MRQINLEDLDPGTLAKMFSDKCDVLTFLSIPFKYSRGKKAWRFMAGCVACMKRERSWEKWRRHIKEDRAEIRRLWAECKTIDLFSEMIEYQRYGGDS